MWVKYVSFSMFCHDLCQRSPLFPFFQLYQYDHLVIVCSCPDTSSLPWLSSKGLADLYLILTYLESMSVLSCQFSILWIFCAMHSWPTDNFIIIHDFPIKRVIWRYLEMEDEEDLVYVEAKRSETYTENTFPICHQGSPPCAEMGANLKNTWWKRDGNSRI